MMTNRPANKHARRDDRGSVLVFVVGVLVLLALAATAYLSTARVDRVTTKQNEFTTQIELLVEAVLNASEAALISDKTVAYSTTPADRQTYDYPFPVSGTDVDSFLASRVPVTFNLLAPFDPGSGNYATWPAVSGPVIGSTFETPDGDTYPSSRRFRLVPTSKLVNGRLLPAFTYDTSTGSAGFQANAGIRILAGDADGDGVADSLPFKLQIGRVNGLEYFAYVRIIDNNSAVNVNTAMTRAADVQGDGTLIGSFNYFTANIGLAELFRTYPNEASSPPTSYTTFGAEFNRLNTYRFGAATVPQGVATAPYTVAPAAAPIRDDGGATDFYWYSVGDVLQHQLSRRPENPGFVTGAVKAKPFGIGESVALASRFILKDSTGMQGDLETALAESVFSHANLRNTPFSPDQAQSSDGTGWFELNFDYGDETPWTGGNRLNGATFLPRRALLTATADTSNLLVPDTIDASVRTALQMNDFVAGGTPKISINTADYGDLVRGFYQTLARDTVAATAYTDAYHGSKFNHDTQASIEQEDTRRQFKSSIRLIPNAAATIASATPGAAPTVAYTSPTLPPEQMMRLRAAISALNLETLRLQNTPTGGTTPSNAAGATTPDEARFRDIQLTLSDNTTITARVYGLQRQPYITEVFAQNDNVTPGPLNGIAGDQFPNYKGYIAIELYNPYDVAIDLSNCKIGLIHRAVRSKGIDPVQPAQPATYPAEFLLEDASVGTEPIDLSATGTLENMNPAGAFSSRMTIPAKGYLILENFEGSRTDKANPTSTAASYRPGAVVRPGFPADQAADGVVLPNVNFTYVRNLHRLFNREFVFLRPQSARLVEQTVLVGGTSSEQQLVLQYFNSVTTPNIARDYMPLDSYDLSGMALYGSLENLSYIYAHARHYQRDTRQWRFVYPGRYDAAHAALNDPNPISNNAYSNQQGTRHSQGWIPTGAPLGATQPSPPVVDTTDTTNPNYPASDVLSPTPDIGVNTAANPRQNSFFSIQLLSPDWPGQKPVNFDTKTNMYPFAHFGRLGDLLQVPFIGSYVMWRGVGAPATDANGNAVIVEANPVTMDAAMAEDTDIDTDPIDQAATAAPPDPNLTPGRDADDSREQLGRYAPLRPMYGSNQSEEQHAATGIGSLLYSDYATNTSNWRYHFATYLFDYFTVESPADDFLANVKHEGTSADTAYKVTTSASPYATVYGLAPEPVRNAGATTANGTAEATLPVRGLININTAPRKVLAMIPWVPQGTDLVSFDISTGELVQTSNNVNDNEEIAAAIEYWRDGNAAAANPVANGPFTTLFDLYRCKAIRQVQQALLENVATKAPNDPNDTYGDLSPAGAGQDGVLYDFEEQYLLLNRVSNLITTRSDTYTVYILLQGWRNAGSAAAELVVERRAAMIVDRSQYTPENGNVTATRVPTN